MNSTVAPVGTPPTQPPGGPGDRPLRRPLTVTDRDHLTGYLRLLDGLIEGPETAHRLIGGLIAALENR